MYAVIKSGGKQYRVEKNAVLQVEKMAGAAGETVTFDDVLMIGDGDKITVGAPQIDGASVTAEVLEQTRGPKIIVFKKKRRKNYRRTRGHRQDLTVVKITDILAEAKKKRATKSKAKAEEAESAAEAKPKDTAQTKSESDSKAKAKTAPKPKAESKAKAAAKPAVAAKDGAAAKPKAKKKAKAASKPAAKAKTPTASEE